MTNPKIGDKVRYKNSPMGSVVGVVINVWGFYSSFVEVEWSNGEVKTHLKEYLEKI